MECGHCAPTPAWAQYAQSEQEITDSSVCGTPGAYALTQIRADFTTCALPANSLTVACVQGFVNEPNDCGFSSNLSGLCSYCAASSPNSTDSCCVFSKTETRCSNVVLPVAATSSLASLFTSSTSSATRPTTATATGAASTSAAAGAGNITNPGLTGGQIAGIVVGSVLGASVLLGLLIGCCVFLRRRRERSPASSLNASSRRGPAM
ncbi:hypothetical protein LTR66_014912, partial [Elasticomyces elasticus]